MWLFCKSGFFSAVQHFDQPDVIHVRARFAGDIERLCATHDIKPVVVEYTPGNDYPYRANFKRAVWADIAKAEAEAIDYTNFKNAVHDDTPRDSAYMRIWGVLRNAQHNLTLRP